MHDGTAVWLENNLLRITVTLVLPHGVRGVLARKVVLELHGHNGNAVQKQHYINGIICVIRHGAVAQLAHHLETIGSILGHKIGVLRRYRLEIAQAKASTRRHVNGSSQTIDQAICVPVGFKLVAYALQELRLGVGAVELFYLGPFSGLGLFYEVHQRIHFQSQLAVVIQLSHRKPATGHALFAKRLPTGPL